MKKITLDLFLHIVGLSAASGIFYKDNNLHFISDDSEVFYSYNLPQNRLYKTSLSADWVIREQMPKSTKPDFEALTTDGTSYYVFGSGSTPYREKLLEINTLTKEVISENELDILYISMKSFAEIDDDDFNIEGVILDKDTWYFFNRGNGPKHKNGIFTVTGNSILDEFNIVYNPVKLPKIKGVQTGFTDAVMVDQSIYFIAAAEDSNSNYSDGKIMGSILGKINPDTMKLEKTKTISRDHKFEGITLMENNKKELVFLLCEDNDQGHNETQVFRLSILK